MSLHLEALETSFDLVAPRGDGLMDEFYSRSFAAAPAVKPLFPVDMHRQKTMLLGALVLLRKSLRDLDAIVRRDPKPLRSGPSPAPPLLRPERAGEVSAR
jgi:hemoglobin-like flavoprotein